MNHLPHPRVDLVLPAAAAEHPVVPDPGLQVMAPALADDRYALPPEEADYHIDSIRLEAEKLSLEGSWGN